MTTSGTSAFRPAAKGTRLDETDPSIGGELVVDRGTWKVASHATYRNPDYHSDEWECRKGATTGYVLKEREGDQVKWFFTIEAPAGVVTLPGGEPLERWRRRETASAPPPSLQFRGGTYRHEESTEGVYEERAGRSLDKTTWEYWDVPHKHNLAIEVWPSGRLEAYHGLYIDPRTVVVRGKSGPGLGCAVAVAALVYFMALLFGVPFDRCTGISLVVLGVLGFVRALAQAPSTVPAGLILAPVLGFVFYRFPPLTTIAGLVTLAAAPAVFARWAVMRQRSASVPGVHAGITAAVPHLPHPGVLGAAFFTIALPVLVVGLDYYFSYAPGPHSLGQYVLAIAPAVLGGIVALLIASVVLRASE